MGSRVELDWPLPKPLCALKGSSVPKYSCWRGSLLPAGEGGAWAGMPILSMLSSRCSVAADLQNFNILYITYYISYVIF